MKKEIDLFIKEFFDEHEEVRFTFFGSDSAYSSISSKEYKAVQIEFISSEINLYAKSFIYKISIEDIYQYNQDENREGEMISEGIISDCIEILNDLFLKLNWFFSEKGLYVENDLVRILSFKEENIDYTAGVVGELNIKIPNEFTVC